MAGREIPPRFRVCWQRHIGPESRMDDLLPALTKGTLVSAIHATALRCPSRPALLMPRTADERWVSHGELDDRAARTTGCLVGLGLRPGDRVLLCGPNSVELVVAYLAILRVGGVVVLANPAYTRSEFVHLITDSGARLAACDTHTANALRGLVDGILNLDTPPPQGQPIGPFTPATAGPALLAYTSGTTGLPKGVPLSHANLLASIRSAMAAWRWREDDVLVHALPLSHQHGLGGVHATLLAGSRAIVLPSFNAPELARSAATHHATVLFGVPAMYERIITDQKAAATVAHVSLRLAVSGSAPLSSELAERLRPVLGKIPLERYGSTEAGLNVSNPIDGPRLAGTVGLPLPGIELRIADSDGATVADGNDGEILVRGPQVFSGYWNQPAATAEAFHPGGWFRTGDVGQLDPVSGYLRVSGRLKELVITGGMNVYPAEVERVLERHPQVSEAAVAGLPSRQWGEQVTAWVVLAEGTDPNDFDTDRLIRHCREALAPYKCPKQVFTTDSLPRNSLGKIMRRALTAGADPGTVEALDSSALDHALTRLRQANLP